MDTPLSRGEHKEFSDKINSEIKRLEAEDKRQNNRIDDMEKDIKHTMSLASSVERLAANMESMLKEQEKQGKRLETLEKRDGEKWRKVMETIITVVVSGVVGFILAHIGL